MSHIDPLIIRRKSLQEINVLIFAQSYGMNTHPPVPIDTLELLKNVIRPGIRGISIRNKEYLSDPRKRQGLLKSPKSIGASTRGELP